MEDRMAIPPEEWCWQTLRDLRWPMGVLCPRCGKGASRHYRRRHASYYRCRSCSRMFSDLTATPFEQTKAPLSTWFLAIGLIFSDDGERQTSFDLARRIRVDYRTACRMRTRLLGMWEDPLVCSIRARVVLWRVKGYWRTECLRDMTSRIHSVLQ